MNKFLAETLVAINAFLAFDVILGGAVVIFYACTAQTVNSVEAILAFVLVIISAVLIFGFVALLGQILKELQAVRESLSGKKLESVSSDQRKEPSL